MPRNITRGELRTRLEQLTDTEGDAHVATTEKNAILNSAVAETWDVICAAGLGEKYVKSVTFSTVAGTTEYALNTSTYVTANDFYRVSRVYVVENSNQLRALRKVQPSELLSFKPPQAAASIKLYYIPSATVFAVGDDAVNFDGINGWEEHTLMTAACAIKMKKEDDYNMFYRRKKELENRIQKAGQVDHGEPARVSRKRLRNRDPWSNFANTINAYVIRGDKLELYYLSGYALA